LGCKNTSGPDVQENDSLKTFNAFRNKLDTPAANINIKLSKVRTFDTIFYEYYYHMLLMHKAYKINLSITNQSDEPIVFYIMTCSWEENFIINNDYIHFLIGQCDGNYPKRRRLNPKERFDIKASVYKIENTLYSEVKETRFGFIYVDSSDCKNPGDFRKIVGDKYRQKVFWSNALDLK